LISGAVEIETDNARRIAWKFQSKICPFAENLDTIETVDSDYISNCYVADFHLPKKSRYLPNSSVLFGMSLVPSNSGSRMNSIFAELSSIKMFSSVKCDC